MFRTTTTTVEDKLDLRSYFLNKFIGKNQAAECQNTWQSDSFTESHQPGQAD